MPGPLGASKAASLVPSPSALPLDSLDRTILRCASAPAGSTNQPERKRTLFVFDPWFGAVVASIKRNPKRPVGTQPLQFPCFLLRLDP